MESEVILYEGGSDFAEIKIEQVASGFQFTEGPLWHPGNYLLFSDTPANKIYQLFPDGSSKVFLDKSGFIGMDTSMLSDMIGSNGLALEDDNIIICQHGDHAIACLNKNMELSVLTDCYEGKPFNSPNDLIIKADESIYFSDPPYGLKDQVPDPDAFQPVAGVYRYFEGKTKRIFDELKYPNGVCFSPDEQILYISSNHGDEPRLYKCLLSVSGDIIEKSVLIEQNADGIATDPEGNLFLSTNDGILIVSPKGQKLALLKLPDSPSNIAWGGHLYSELYITARSNIYRAKNFK
ncbi:MAG: SMP-30/gluconolactonase/LRE family protein [Chitinophagaceae bacterium]